MKHYADQSASHNPPVGGGPPTGPLNTTGARGTGAVVDVSASMIGKDLRSYGATGDGATDDTSSVNAALADICANGGALIIPDLTFRIVGELKMSRCTQPWRISGAGLKATLAFQGQSVGLYIENNEVRGSIEELTFGGTSGQAIELYNDQHITLYKNVITGGGAIVPAGGPQAGLWVQGGSDITVEENTFTGNGPEIGSGCVSSTGTAVACPSGYDFVSNFFYYPGNLTASTTERLRLIGNRIYGSNTQISMVAFNACDSEITGNYIDQNDAYRNEATVYALGGQGYGINVYGNAHVGGSSGNWVSTVLAGGTVTTIMTRGSVIPYVVGQWVCANSALGSINNTDFDGCYQITGVNGSGGSTPSFSWSRIGANDSASAIDIVNAVPRTTITGNHVENTAGSCIYAQSMIDGHVDDNVVSKCAQMLPSTSIPMAGITVSGATRLTVNNNTINTAISLNANPIKGQIYIPSGIAAAMSYDSTYNGNTVTNFAGNGILLGQGRLNNVSGNTIDGATVGSSGVYTVPGAALSLLTESHNAIQRVRYAGIGTGGGIPPGYGTGIVFSNNVIGGNVPSSPMAYCIQLVHGFVGASIEGNSCAGMDSAAAVNGSAMKEGIDDGGLATQIVGNTVSSVSDYGYLESGTDAQVSGNYGYNDHNSFAATGSKRGRVHDNVFGVYSSMAGIGIVWNPDTLHWGNQFTDGPDQGTCRLVAGSCTVSTHEVQTWSMIRLTRRTAEGTLGELSIGAVAANTSFVIESNSGGDTSTVFWEIVH